MKESYEKGLASRSASNPTLAMVTSRVWHGQEAHAGQASPEGTRLRWSPLSRAHAVLTVEGNTRHDATWRVVPRRGGDGHSPGKRRGEVARRNRYLACARQPGVAAAKTVARAMRLAARSPTVPRSAAERK